MIKSLPSSGFLGAVFCFGTAILVGCAHAPTTGDREASYAPYADVRLPDPWVGAVVELRHYMEIRTALISYEDSKRWGFGLATAIDRRGYFLTAAHCVNGDRVSLHVIHRLRGTEAIDSASEEAVVVWRGDTRQGEPDLALLYDPRPPEGFFELSDQSLFPSGEPVFGAGVNYEDLEKQLALAAGGVAGKLLRTDKQTSRTADWTLLVDDLPLHGGDSGGPLATRDGRLIGINFAAGNKWTGSHIAHASRPDIAWLRRKMDDDYARRPNAGAIAEFWSKPNPAESLAHLLLERLRDQEAARIARNEPDDIKAAYFRQELVVRVVGDEAGITGQSAGEIAGTLRRFTAGKPTPQPDFDQVLAVLHTKLQMK